MPTGNGKSSYRKERTWTHILPCGVLPNSGGVNDYDDFHHAFFLTITLSVRSAQTLNFYDDIITSWKTNVLHLLIIKSTKSLVTHIIRYL